MFERCQMREIRPMWRQTRETPRKLLTDTGQAGHRRSTKLHVMFRVSGGVRNVPEHCSEAERSERHRNSGYTNPWRCSHPETKGGHRSNGDSLKVATENAGHDEFQTSVCPSSSAPIGAKLWQRAFQKIVTSIFPFQSFF